MTTVGYGDIKPVTEYEVPAPNLHDIYSLETPYLFVPEQFRRSVPVIASGREGAARAEDAQGTPRVIYDRVY